ncbi:MAG: lamin tail domain-containing protein [Alphaproteobacteria bacterium]|nr:lamin tail domain-containing protein [Alphaproteobacteria bacterium]
MTKHTFAALLLLAAGCGEKEPADDSDTPTDDTSADDSAVDDSSADDSAADDSGTEAQLSGVRLAASAITLSTRETVSLTLTALYDDGSEVEVTGDAAFSSSDEGALRFFEPSTGQPLDGGVVTVTGEHGGHSDVLELTITVSPATSGDLVLNELLIDGAAEGDPNGDGSIDDLEDEFVEIGNLSGVSVDLTGVTLSERDAGPVRHTFAEGTTLKPGEVIVVFGGGDVSGLSADNAWFVVADNVDPGEPLGLALTNSGDTVLLSAADGTQIARLSYGSADLSDTVPTAADTSLQLSPDIEGSSYVEHSSLGGDAYSPGTQADGSAFPGVDGVFGG